MADLRQRNTLQFQYFLDFNKCLREIFSQLSFESFWLYLLGEVDMTQKLLKMIKNILRHHTPEKIHELTV